MNINDISADQINRMVAEIVFKEPQPFLATDSQTAETALMRQLSGNAIISEKGCWMLLCEYENGDIPEWEAVNFLENDKYSWKLLSFLISSGHKISIVSYKLNQNVMFMTFINDDMKGQASTSQLSLCRAALNYFS